MKREELTRYLDEILDAGRFKDYCPNGLQVEGRPEIRSLVAGVTASQALLDVAVARAADVILVHHGWFWRGEDGRVTGIRRTRLQTLLHNDINLIAYHLPLDSHPQFGNNAQLGQALRLAARRPLRRAGHRLARTTGKAGQPSPRSANTSQRCCNASRCSSATASARSSASPGVQAVRKGSSKRPSRWASDLYLSGEISEQTVHLARESGVAYLAAGHHASERYGVQALAAHLAERFGLDCHFADLDNPV
jgi:dinuclear metal center YbgI/SA1388 family protein